MTSRSAMFSINCYTLHICRHTRWYFMSYGLPLVTFQQLKMSILNFSCSTLNIKPKISSSLNTASSGKLDSNLSDRGQGTVCQSVDFTAILKSPINPWLGAESKRILTSLKSLLHFAISSQVLQKSKLHAAKHHDLGQIPQKHDT